MEPLRENNRVQKVKFKGVPEIDKESRLRNRKRKSVVPVPVVKMETKVPDFLVYQALVRLTFDEFQTKCNDPLFQVNVRGMLQHMGVEGVHGKTVQTLFDIVTRTSADQFPPEFARLFQMFLPLNVYFENASPRSALTDGTVGRGVATITNLYVVNNFRLFEETLLLALTTAKGAAANTGITDPDEIKPIFNEQYVQSSALFCDTFANLRGIEVDPDSSMNLTDVYKTMREAIAGHLGQSRVEENVVSAIEDHIVNRNYD